MAAYVRGLTGLGLALVLLTSAACGNKPSTGTSSPSSAAVVPSAVTITDPAAAKAVKEGVEAYVNMLNAFYAASNAGSADPAGVAKYTSGGALVTLQTILTNYKAIDVHTVGTPRIDPPTVTEVSPTTDPTTIKLTGCVDNSKVKFVKADGTAADQLGPQQTQTASAVTATVAKGADGWKVTDFAIGGAC